MKFAKRVLATLFALTLLSSSVLPVISSRASADPVNLIANESVETADPANSAVPQAWSQGGWGTNTRSFSYLNTGHIGTHSLKAQISSYTSGDAKWYFSPVAVQASTKYSYSDYYQSDIAGDVVAQLDDGSGNYTYQDLGAASSSSDWKQYSASFTTSASTKQVTLFHLIAGIGSVTTDDFSLSQTPADTTPPDSNLVANPSTETADPNNSSSPASWLQDKWGVNSPSFSYLNTGHNGGHSVKVQISSYTSGDAKWYFAPVAVQAGSSYTFSDYYESTIANDVVAQYDDGSGNYTYQDLGPAAAASNWQQYQKSFTVPSGVKDVTIFHLIAGVGSLTVDDYSLTASPAPTDNDLIANHSVETPDAVNPVTPAGWYEGTYGNNTSAFVYGTTGHTGSRSVTINMSNFTDGGANWSYDAPTVQPGKVYEFSDYYQSNTFTQALVAVKMSDGTTQYVWLGNPYTSDGSWTRFFATFTMPAGAVSATAYQSIAGNGYLTTDDYDLEPYTPSGFSSPMVSVTFDDGIASQTTQGLPVLQKYGLKGTFYAISGDLNVCDPNVSSLCYMTNAQLQALQNAGQEIGSHTVTHPDLTTLTASQVDTELHASQDALQELLGVPIANFAAPYGNVNLSVLNATNTYYMSQRGVEAGYNSIDNYNQMDLLVQDVDTDTTVQQVESYIDYAKATNTWLILVFHDINSDTTVDPGYDTTPADFDTEMAYLKASGVMVPTINEGIQLAAPQAGQ